MTNTILMQRPVDDLEPQIIAIAIPPFIAPGQRATPLFHIKRVGAVYFVEQMSYKRAADNTTTEDWNGVAIAKGKDARREAFEWMADANMQAIKLSVASPQRSGE